MNTSKTQTKPSVKKLGFTVKESSEIAMGLKQLLANYHMFYHKLRNFHWNIEGPDFFELHEEFDKEYASVEKTIDIIAERIRVFNIKPMLTMSHIVEISKIKDVDKHLSATGMVSELLKDYEILHDNLLTVLNTALEAGDNVTEQIVTDLMRSLEKRNWMFTAWCK